MRIGRCLMALLLLTDATSGGLAQAATSRKEQLIGTWTFVIAEITAADGSKSLPFGEAPKGISDLHAGRPFRANSHRQRCAEDCLQQSPDGNGGRICRHQAEELIAVWHLQRGRGQAHGDLQHHLEPVSQLAGRVADAND